MQVALYENLIILNELLDNWKIWAKKLMPLSTSTQHNLILLLKNLLTVSRGPLLACVVKFIWKKQQGESPPRVFPERFIGKGGGGAP